MTTERTMTRDEKRAVVRQERWHLLHQLVCIVRTPMTVLSFVWVGLVIVNLVSGLPLILQWLSWLIWAFFVVEVLIELFIAPDRRVYLQQHWLVVISLLLPAFGTLSALRVVQALASSGSLSLVRVLTAINRGMAATRHLVGKRKVGYVAGLTVLVMLVGAAGMFSFENPSMLRAQGYAHTVQQGGGLHSYGEAVWWTAMIMTTMGSVYWPVTLAGRILCWLLALYAFGVFGYITAILASYFVGIDISPDVRHERAGEQAANAAVGDELRALREQLAAVVERLDRTAVASDAVQVPGRSASTTAGG